MSMLAASMQAEKKRQDWRDYIAQIVWSIGKLQAEEYPFPSWAELTMDKPEEPDGEDIYNTLKTRWGGGE